MLDRGISSQSCNTQPCDCPTTCQADCTYSSISTPICVDEVKTYTLLKNQKTELEKMLDAEQKNLGTLKQQMRDAETNLLKARAAEKSIREMLKALEPRAYDMEYECLVKGKIHWWATQFACTRVNRGKLTGKTRLGAARTTSRVCYNDKNVSIHTPTTVGTLSYQLLDAAAPNFNCTSPIGDVFKAMDSPNPATVCKASSTTLKALTGLNVPIRLNPDCSVNQIETTKKCAEAIFGSAGEISFSCPGPKTFRKLTKCKIWSPAMVAGGMAAAVGSFLWDNSTCFAPNRWVVAPTIYKDLNSVLTQLVAKIPGIETVYNESKTEVNNQEKEITDTLSMISRKKQEVQMAGNAMTDCTWRAGISAAELREMKAQCGLRR